MDSLYTATLSALLYVCSKEKGSALHKYFPKEVADALASHEPKTALPCSFLNTQKGLEQIHYSWLIPLLARFSSDLHPFLIASLPPSQQQTIVALTKAQFPIPPLSPQAKQFFQNKLYHDWLTQEKIQPREFLSANPLNGLLELSRPALITLIDCLGVEDLSLDLRKALDKQFLDKIKGSLTPQQRSYLDHCLKQPNLVALKNETLAYWQKNAKVLASLIHQKGLLRLANGLVGSDEQLIWHLCHYLDTGRAKELSRCLALHQVINVSPKIKAAIIDQIVGLAKALGGHKS